jgi:hypothetical protein
MPAHNRDPSDRFECEASANAERDLRTPAGRRVPVRPGRTARGGTEEKVGTCRGVTGPGDSQLR